MSIPAVLVCRAPRAHCRAPRAPPASVVAQSKSQGIFQTQVLSEAQQSKKVVESTLRCILRVCVGGGVPGDSWAPESPRRVRSEGCERRDVVTDPGTKTTMLKYSGTVTELWNLSRESSSEHYEYAFCVRVRV